MIPGPPLSRYKEADIGRGWTKIRKECGKKAGKGEKGLHMWTGGKGGIAMETGKEIESWKEQMTGEERGGGGEKRRKEGWEEMGGAPMI